MLSFKWVQGGFVVDFASMPLPTVHPLALCVYRVKNSYDNSRNNKLASNLLVKSFACLMILEVLQKLCCSEAEEGC